MAGFFYNLGQMIGPKLRKANWVYRSLAGTEAEAWRAEYAVGRDLAAALAGQMQPDPDPAVARWLDEFRDRLAAGLKGSHWRFAFRAVLWPEANAFALPGGFVFVTRELLRLCRGDADETAFLLAHEMAHVVRRHAIDRLMANSVVGAALGRIGAGGLLRQPLAGLAASLLNQGYSRDQELEADAFGARLAACAGFDPAAALRLLGRLRTLAAEPPALGGYFSSHPAPEERIRRLGQMLRTR
jgi:predicted Zn-dependent protease